MNLPRKQADKLIRNFLSTLELPENYRRLDRGVDSDTQERCFDIQITLLWQGREKPAEYRVLSLRVNEKEEVRIADDRRPYIEETLCNPRVSVVERSPVYDEQEAQELFMEYVAATRDMTPTWVSSIEAGNEAHVRNGIDAWVYFQNKQGKTCKAPIKVCPHLAAKAQYMSKRKPKEIAKILAIVMRPGVERIGTMRTFFQLLENKRNNGSY